MYIDKLKELKDLMKDIALRAYEKEERPKALAALKQHLNATNNFLETVHNMSDPDDPMFTPVELQTLEKLINETTVSIVLLTFCLVCCCFFVVVTVCKHACVLYSFPSCFCNSSYR